MISERTGHKQVSFSLANGESVEVDEGMVEVLTHLRQLGVGTRFSCEGTERFSAYVLADALDFNRLVRRIKRLYHKGAYSTGSETVVRNFLKGYREVEFASFKTKRAGGPQYCNWTVEHQRGRKMDQGFAYELSYSRTYGYRLTLRWPGIFNDAVKRLLEETINK